MERTKYIDEISKRLGQRSLLWWGIRGSDAAVLFQIPQFSQIFSFAAPLEGPKVSQVCLETLQRKRVDLHTYDPDRDNSRGARKLYGLLFEALSLPVAVLPYRADNFLAGIYFQQAKNAEYLGLFLQQEAVFENKAWVETELKKYGIRTISWSYYGKYNTPALQRLLSQGPIVVRSENSTPSRGGVGLFLLREPSEADIALPARHNTPYATSHYLEPNIPLNVNACLFRDGTVSFHGISLQLIGVPSCTDHSLGWCGNDFARVHNLDGDTLNELETMTVQVGKWLADKGYLGVFGIDAVVYQEHVYFSEINPRFQGSSKLSAEIERQLDRPDVYLSHMAAFLGIPPPPYTPLRELARQQRGVSQIISYNRCPQSVLRKDSPIIERNGITLTSLPAPNVKVVPGGMLYRAEVEGQVTGDGHFLLDQYERQISRINGIFHANRSK